MSYYSCPEEYGLEVVGTVYWAKPTYSFDMTVVWWDPQLRRFVWGSDNGCSCPSPFQDTRFEELAQGRDHEVIAALISRLEKEIATRDYDDEQCYGSAAAVDLVTKIRSPKYHIIIREAEEIVL